MSVPYGSNVSLPCTVEVASPLPLYDWECVSAEDSLPEVNETLSDGSLQLRNVQRSGVYRCTAHNGYGNSTQIIELSKLYN